jgi:hypothetical protein
MAATRRRYFDAEPTMLDLTMVPPNLRGRSATGVQQPSNGEVDLLVLAFAGRILKIRFRCPVPTLNLIKAICAMSLTKKPPAGMPEAFGGLKISRVFPLLLWVDVRSFAERER